MDRSSLEVLLSQGLSLEEIGRRYGKPPGTVGYWVKKHGLRAVGADRFAPRGGLTREELAPLAEEGLPLREIAARLDRSIATVRHWLKKHDLERVRRGRRPSNRAAPDAPAYDVRECRIHGSVIFGLRHGYYRCLQCIQERVVDRRRVVKQILVAEAGGACRLCGYNAYLGALQFHHLEPARKEFGIGGRGLTRGIRKLREEAKKCVLLCANCHAEVEAGVVTVEATRARVPP